MFMRLLLVTALASALTLGLPACSDDPTPVPGTEDTGDTATGDTGAGDAGNGDADATDDSGPTCESGVECVRLSDCITAGLTNNQCAAGCCVESTIPTPDAGPDPVPCGHVTFQGECQGNTVVWCDNDNLSQVDCSAFYTDGTGTCDWFGDDFGSWCGLAEGDSCIDAEGNFLLCAGGVGNACVVAPGEDFFEIACAPGEFTECDSETFEGSVCQGDFAVIDCAVNHPVAFDCVAFGATCDDGTCVGVPVGSECVLDTVDLEFTEPDRPDFAYPRASHPLW